MNGRGRVTIAQQITECAAPGSIMAVEAIPMQEAVFKYSVSLRLVRNLKMPPSQKGSLNFQSFIEMPEDLNEPTELSVMWYYTSEFDAANGGDPQLEIEQIMNVANLGYAKSNLNLTLRTLNMEKLPDTFLEIDDQWAMMDNLIRLKGIHLRYLYFGANLLTYVCRGCDTTEANSRHCHSGSLRRERRGMWSG